MGVLQRALYGAVASSYTASGEPMSSVTVTGNPHSADPSGQCPAIKAGGHSCVGNENIVPENVIAIPFGNLQKDTVRAIVPKKIKNPYSFPSIFRANIYHFVQSPRLVEKFQILNMIQQLPFKLLLLKGLTGIVTGGVHVVPVDTPSASDSWFPGYRWSLLLCSGNNNIEHLGWEFSSATTNDKFYAVIVDHKDEDELAVKSSVQKARISELLAEALEIKPRKADAWMLTAFATAYKIKKGAR